MAGMSVFQTSFLESPHGNRGIKAEPAEEPVTPPASPAQSVSTGALSSPKFDSDDEHAEAITDTDA
jgi:hypothetical protein